MEKTRILSILVLGLMVWLVPKVEAVPLGTAWTYQGQLMDANDTADGEYDFQFKLYDAPNGGVQEGNTIDVNNLDVIDGYFTVVLDFGGGVFDGDARWLEIGVRPGDSNNFDAFVTLSPRQEVTPAPYSLYAQNAGADNDWIVSGSSMYSVPGRVGIGTKDPGTTTLFVQKPSAVAPLYVSQDGLVIKNGNRCIGNQLEVQDSSGNTQFVITGSRVGIGTDSPGAGLHLKGTGHPSSFMYLQSDPDDDAGFRLYEDTALKWHLFNESAADGLSLRNSAYSSVLFADQDTCNIGIGTTAPVGKLHVKSRIRIEGSDTSFPFLDLVNWAGTGKWTLYGNNDNDFRIAEYVGILRGDRIVIKEGGNVGIGTTSPSAGLHLKGSGYPSSFMYLQSNSGQDAGIRLYEGDTEKWHIFNSSSDGGLMICNNAYTPVLFADQSTGNVRVRVLEITGGDLVEGFDTGDDTCKPGTVMVIDSNNPGQLAPSTTAYDRKVAGVVSGAGGVSHGIQMGKQEALDGDTLVAMTGRVYCLADASNGEVTPGDLLTTSHTPGHAMKVTDHDRANGAILGKAMSRLEAGKKGLVLVLVALQ